MALSAGTEFHHKTVIDLQCILLLLCGSPCTTDDNLNNITAEKWESIQEKAPGWKGIDRFGKVHETVDWQKGPKGHHMHSAYYTSLSSKRMLSQADNNNAKQTMTLKMSIHKI